MNNQRLDDTKKWKLINIIVSKYKIPANVFVERVVTDLALNGHSKAKATLINWFQNDDYYKKSEFYNEVSFTINTLLKNDFKFAVELFTEFINTDLFISKFEIHHVYEIAQILNEIINKDVPIGLEILNRVWSKSTLSVNEQILVSHSLFKTVSNTSENPEVIKKIYANFVDLLLTQLKNDSVIIYSKIFHNHAREAFVRFTVRLAENKMVKEAVRIAEVFVNDPDPFLPGKDPEDPKAEYSEHKRIERGEGVLSIQSVRGQVCWALAQCVIPEGRDCLDKIINLTEKLIDDENYYIKYMACYPLSRLAYNRFTHMPNQPDVPFLGNDWRIALEKSKKIEALAFRLLDEINDFLLNVKKSLSEALFRVFREIKTLYQDEAQRLLTVIKSFPEEAIIGATPFFIYYAEFRKNAFNSWRVHFPGLYADLSSDYYDDRVFKDILIELLKNGSKNIRKQFAFQFSHLEKEKSTEKFIDTGNDIFSISFSYLKIISQQFEIITSHDLYYFICKNMDYQERFEKCYELFWDCLKTERDTLENMVNINNKIEYNKKWSWSSYIEDIMLHIYRKLGNIAFLEAFDYLVNYPLEADIGSVAELVNVLKKFPKNNRQVENIFNRLIERNPIYFDAKQEWLNK